MPGPRQTLQVIEANGKKHLSKAEKAQRAAEEVKVEAPKQIRAPAYLPAELKDEFRELGRRLRDVGLYTALDADNLARYLMAKSMYLAITDQLKASMASWFNIKAVSELSLLQDRYFKQCRACANDMGLTVTSRCRLVLPEAAKPEENAFEAMMRERQKRA